MSAHIRKHLDPVGIAYDDQRLVQKLDCPVVADVGQFVGPANAMPVPAQNGFAFVVKIGGVCIEPPGWASRKNFGFFASSRSSASFVLLDLIGACAGSSGSSLSCRRISFWLCSTDCEAAAAWWERVFGVGPFSTDTYILDSSTNFHFKGKPAEAKMKASIAYSGKVFRGRIAMLDSRVEAASRSLTVKALLDNADSLLRPGQFLQVSVLLAEHPALLVPEQAVISQGAQSYVFTVSNDDVAERLPVSLGGRRDGWVEITAGLDQGQPVIVNGHSRLGSGAPVKVVEDEGALMPAQRALLEEPA